MNLEIYLISDGISIDVRTLDENDYDYYKEYIYEYIPTYSILSVKYSESSKAALVSNLNNHDYDILLNKVYKVDEKLVLYFKKILLIFNVLIPYKNNKKTHKCSLCRKSGHNKRTCRKIKN
jgi:hypothetical protein